jgi:hypothetical protein
MNTSKSFSMASTVSLCALMLIILSACDCFPCGGDGTVAAPVGRSYLQLAPIAPPPPMFEQPEISSNPRAAVWRPGYWDYDGGNYHWVSGEWIARPSPTAIWSPDHWMQHTYGWGFIPGYWQ